MKKFRQFIFICVEDTARLPAKVFNLLMMGLIIVSMVVWLLDTNKEITSEWGWLFQKIEYFCMVSFIGEYALRWLAFDGPIWRFPFKTMSIIDALAVLPFFFSGSSNTAALRLLRIFRVFRIFKLARYNEAIGRLIQVFHQNASVLGVFLFVVVIILLISSALMHAIEPTRFAQMTDALWWSIVTLTTVGYGDIVPDSLLGKFVAGILMILGIGIIALPTGVLGASLTKLMADEKNIHDVACSRCGETKHLTEARFCWRCGEKLVS